MNNEENMKVDAEDIIKSFKVENVNAFSSYLKEVWMVSVIFHNNIGFTSKRTRQM